MRKEDFVGVVCNELDNNKDLSVNKQFSHGDFVPHECNGLHIFPCGAQSERTGSGSVELEDDKKDHTKSEYQNSSDRLLNPAVTMLSSTVVTVLAPHWSGRLRRSKRFEGTRNSVHGSLQDVRNMESNHASGSFQETQSQHGVESRLKDESQPQPRVRFLDSRSNTMDWSTESGPSRLDYDSKRKMLQTFSVDVNSGRTNKREGDAGPTRHRLTTASPLSPRSNPQAGHQGTASTLSSKPTTSSLLLSLRRINTGGLNTKTGSSFSEENRSCDREGKLFASHLSQTFLNKNEQDRPKSHFPPSSLSYRTVESRPALSTLSSNHRDRNTSESRYFPASSVNRDTDSTPLTQQPQTGSKMAFMSREMLEREQSFRDSDKNANLPSKSSVMTPRYLQYDPSALLKPNPHPRGTTLTTTSWWKQVTPEGSSPQNNNDPTNKDQTNMPCNINSHLVSPGPLDNKRFSNQIPSNRYNRSTTESVSKGNRNVFMKPQRGTTNLRQRNSEDSSDQKAERLFKHQYHSSLDTQESQKLYHLPVLSPSKIRRTASQTSLSHSTDLGKHDVSNSSFTPNVTESPPTLLDLKRSNTPTENSRKYNNNNWSSKTNSALLSPQLKESEKFKKQPLSLATTITLDSQALTSKATSGLPLTPNINTSSSFHSNPVSSQTSTHTSLHTDSSPQAHKSINTASPLGFERSSIPIPLHTKPPSGLIPTVSALSIPKYISGSTASISSSTTSGPSPSLLIPATTCAVASSPTSSTFSSLLTPPATPITTSANYSKTPSPKGERAFSSSPERDPKAARPHVGGKGARRVTWDDSVDLQHPETVTLEKPHLSPTRPLSPTTSPRSVRAPSIFSFLRSNSATTNTSPVCSLAPQTSNMEVGKGGKYRSLSSDSADLTSRELQRSKQRPCDPTISYLGKQDLTTPRQERTLSVESGTVQCSSSSPLVFPDFSSAYKLRYSSTPYSTLMSTRSTQGETKPVSPRSPCFPESPRQIYSSSHTDHHSAMTIPASKPPLSPISPSQTISLPFQKKTAMQEIPKSWVSETNQVNNNYAKDSSQNNQNGKILLVDNRYHISSQSLQGDSSCVTQTLVYSIKPKVDTAKPVPKITTSKPSQHSGNTVASLDTTLKQQPLTMQIKGASGEQCSRSDQSSSGDSSVDSQSQDDERHRRRVKESVLGKSRFFSVENSSEQSPKRSRFALKKSVSSPNSILSRSDSDRGNKTNNKMDQVLNKLKQTFSTKRSDDDPSFPWKWKRSSQAPPVSESNDSQSAGDTLEEQEEGQVVSKDNENIIEDTNRYTIIPPSPVVGTTAEDKFPVWLERSTSDAAQNEQEVYTGQKPESKTQVHLTAHNQKPHQFDLHNNNRTDHSPTNQFPTHRDVSPGRSPNLSTGYPQFRKSTPSPRSPFSPFSTLAPLSPFTPPDVTDDSVFYSPKLQRRRESPSPCEPGEGLTLGGSRRRLSTGPPSSGPGPEMEHLASSYADLKYGIEPGKSFSVSSVLSSRPSGPGRISTGPRFKSVGDLSSLTCEGSGKDWDQWSSTPDWTAMSHGPRPSSNSKMPYFPSDPGKMRSRSLPRSLTRCLSNCSSEVVISQPVTSVASKPSHLWSPNMNICHFRWDTEGPPTPPPTPPQSPPSRRISKPTSPSSPVFPSLPGAQSVESQASRGHLPSRGYISSLSTFEESSDSSSDTTTDDEYYLETGEGEEKETEL